MAFGDSCYNEELPYVAGEVRTKERTFEVYFLVDTGANACVLPKDLLQRMGKISVKTEKVKTANGLIERNVYKDVEFWFPIFDFKSSEFKPQPGHYLGEVDDWGSDKRMSGRNEGTVFNINGEEKLVFLGTLGINALKSENIRSIKFIDSWTGVMLLKNHLIPSGEPESRLKEINFQ